MSLATRAITLTKGDKHKWSQQIHSLQTDINNKTIQIRVAA